MNAFVCRALGIDGGHDGSGIVPSRGPSTC